MAEKKVEKRTKGFVFATEAVIAMLAFAVMLASFYDAHSFTGNSAKELLALQQANDLLRVWSEKTSSNGEMAQDAKLLLGKNAEVWVEAEQILAAQRTTHAISTEGIILNDNLREEKVRIVVYFH